MQIDDAELAQYLTEIEQYARPYSSQQRGETAGKSPKPRKPQKKAQPAEDAKPSVSRRDRRSAEAEPLPEYPEVLTSKDVKRLATPQPQLATPSSVQQSRSLEQQSSIMKAHLKQQNAAMKAHIERLVAELNELKSADYERSLDNILEENNQLKAALAAAQLEAKTHEKAAIASREKLAYLEKYYSTETGNTKKERQLILALEQQRQENKKLKVQVYYGLREKEQLKMAVEELQRSTRKPKAAK